MRDALPGEVKSSGFLLWAGKEGCEHGGSRLGMCASSIMSIVREVSLTICEEYWNAVRLPRTLMVWSWWWLGLRAFRGYRIVWTWWTALSGSHVLCRNGLSIGATKGTQCCDFRSLWYSYTPMLFFWEYSMWERHAENSRKTLHCAFKILNNRFLQLCHGMRLHEEDVA